MPDPGQSPGQAVEERTVLRVLIVDDHRTFAELLEMALESEPDITCVGHLQDGADIVGQVASRDADVVLVDVHLGRHDGLEVARELVAALPGLRVIMLTASSDAMNIARAAAAGACGYVPKGGPLAEVLAAVRTARPGGLVLRTDMVLDLAALERRETRSTPPVLLTGREQQVLDLLAQGLDVNAIGRRLGIRTSTCRGYVQNILAKLDVHTQLEAVVEATARGLVTVGSADNGSSRSGS